MTERYLVMTSSARGPRGSKDTYKNVAIVELEPGAARPKMISPRAEGMRRVLRHWGACRVGTTERGAYQRALAEAEKLAAELNAHQTSEE